MIYLILSFILNIRAELQIEARIPLKLSGYNKIKKQFSGKPKPRNDLYFDYFDGTKFHLEKLNQPIKLRFKEKNNSVDMQISTKEQSNVISSCVKMDFFVTLKNTYEEEINRNDYLQIMSQSRIALKKMLTPDFNNIEQSFIEIKDLIAQLNHEQWAMIAQSSPRAKNHLVPTFWATRTKFEKILTYNSKRIKLTLKSSKSYDIKSNEFNSYEIEFQPEDSQEWSQQEFNQAVCSFVPEEIETEDIETIEHLEKDSSLKQYINQKHKLGF